MILGICFLKNAFLSVNLSCGTAMTGPGEKLLLAKLSFYKRVDPAKKDRYAKESARLQ